MAIWNAFSSSIFYQTY